MKFKMLQTTPTFKPIEFEGIKNEAVLAVGGNDPGYREEFPIFIMD